MKVMERCVKVIIGWCEGDGGMCEGEWMVCEGEGISNKGDVNVFEGDDGMGFECEWRV